MKFKWLNESTINEFENRIEIMAPAQTDFSVVAVTNAKKVFFLSPFAMHLITIQKWKEILFFELKYPTILRIHTIPHLLWL